jgi:hypothetical protein
VTVLNEISTFQSHEEEQTLFGSYSSGAIGRGEFTVAHVNLPIFK